MIYVLLARSTRMAALRLNSSATFFGSVDRQIKTKLCKQEMGTAVAPGIKMFQSLLRGSIATDRGPGLQGRNISSCSLASSTKCRSWPDQLKRTSPHSQMVTTQVFFSKLSSEDCNNFNSNLLDKIKERLGFRQKSGYLVTEEDVGKEVRDESVINEALESEMRRANLRSSTTAEEIGDEEIVSITRDEVDPRKLWERREKDLNAEERRPLLTSPGFSFSPAGLLFPYHLGVCELLMERGFLTENTPLAGSSAGAIVCAVVAGGVKMSEAMRATKELARDCRDNRTVFRLGAVLRIFLSNFLPEDVHLKVNGRIRIGITQLFQRPRGLLVDQFDSKEDLIDALHTSCFIPGYLAPRPYTVYRNRMCIDGGLTLFMPPTAAEKTVHVRAFSAALYGIKGVDITPDINPKETRPSNMQLLTWALEPAEDDILDEIFELGYEDAMVWAERQCPPP